MSEAKRNGAYCSQYGRVYLRIVSLDENFQLRAVDHGMPITEAICIHAELGRAIEVAARIESGRVPTPHLDIRGLMPTVRGEGA